MILRGLSQYRNPDAVPFGYARKPLGFTLSLWPAGDGCTLISHREEEGRVPTQTVPNVTRAGTQPVPMLGCDNAPYVLGVPKIGADEDSAKRKHSLFKKLVEEFCDSTGEHTAHVYLEWLGKGRPGLTAAVDALSDAARKRLDMDLVGIAVEGAPGSLHDRVDAQAFWGDRVRGQKASGSGGLCIVCGEGGKPLVSSLPQPLVGHLVPGATQANVALVSANFGAAQRGASGDGLRSAPICADCGSKAVQSFNALAASKEHTWRSATNDVGLTWWTSSEAADEAIVQLFGPQPGWVREWLDAPRRGKQAQSSANDDEWFYSITYSGSTARFVVRRFVRLPLAQVQDHIRRWFVDVESPAADHPYFPLTRYAESLGVMRRESSKWVTSPPSGAVESLMAAAMTGLRVPPNYLSLALARAGAEVRFTSSDDGLTAGIARRRMEARAGLIRMILNRTVLKENPMPPHLDSERSDPAYQSGRLFAVRESLQGAAVKGVNASITDKYFERAMSNPRSVEAGLAALSQQHIRALRRSEEMRGRAIWFGRQIDAIGSRRGDAPGRLSPPEQAAWLTGYYQQRHHDLEVAVARKEARQQAESSTAPAPKALNDGMDGKS